MIIVYESSMIQSYFIIYLYESINYDRERKTNRCWDEMWWL